MAARDSDLVTINAGVLRKVCLAMQESLNDAAFARNEPWWVEDLKVLNEARSALGGTRPLAYDEKRRRLA